jgi:hypothetical protein
MDDIAPATSRRALLRALTTIPVATQTAPVALPWGKALATLHAHYDDPPANLVRTKAGRNLSRFRYHNAESFCRGLDQGLYDRDVNEMLYQSGIVAQLALSSHLLDVGFADEWNARHVRLNVAKSLAYANATGFGHDCPDMAQLAAVLSPYWKWGHAHRFDKPRPDAGGFTLDAVRPLLCALLDRVHDVTGHRRPNGWRREQREMLS